MDAPEGHHKRGYLLPVVKIDEQQFEMSLLSRRSPHRGVRVIHATSKDTAKRPDKAGGEIVLHLRGSVFSTEVLRECAIPLEVAAA